MIRVVLLGYLVLALPLSAALWSTCVLSSRISRHEETHA